MVPVLWYTVRYWDAAELQPCMPSLPQNLVLRRKIHSVLVTKNHITSHLSYHASNCTWSRKICPQSVRVNKNRGLLLRLLTRSTISHTGGSALNNMKHQLLQLRILFVLRKSCSEARCLRKTNLQERL